MGWERGCDFGYGPGMMGMGGPLSIIGTLLGGLLLLGLLALLVVAIIWAVRRAGRSTSATQSSADLPPLALAQRRLATGEITVEEYNRLREVLST
jgi:uncharacterized membrane protein